MRKQTSNPIEGGQNVLDPIVLFNSFGHFNCGIVSGPREQYRHVRETAAECEPIERYRCGLGFGLAYCRH